MDLGRVKKESEEPFVSHVVGEFETIEHGNARAFSTRDGLIGLLLRIEIRLEQLDRFGRSIDDPHEARGTDQGESDRMLGSSGGI